MVIFLPKGFSRVLIFHMRETERAKMMCSGDKSRNFTADCMGMDTGIPTDQKKEKKKKKKQFPPNTSKITP